MQKEITVEQRGLANQREYRIIGTVNWLVPQLGEILDGPHVRNLIAEGVKVTILLPTK